MKIRILANTLRLRLSRPELKALAEDGKVSDTTVFGPGQSLTYSLERSAVADRATASYTGRMILVVLPDEAALSWINTDEVSIMAEQDNGEEKKLSLLIEKDFRCLSERPGEDEEDLFPHPKEGQMDC